MPKHIIQLINKTLVLYLVFFIAIYSPVLMAQLSTTETPKTKIAVLDFKGKNIPATDAMIITDLFRDRLFDTGKFQLLDKSVVENIITKFNYAAAGICDVECAINIGENLQSDKVISGDVSKLGTKYIISIRMVDVSNATLQLTATFEKECRLEDLTLEMPGIISQFMEKYTVTVGANTAIAQKVPKEPIKTASPFEKIKDFDPIMLFEPKEQSKADLEIKMLESKPSGKIKINVDQKESVIFCNSKVLGISPLAEKEMEAGTYDLKVQKPGFKTYEGKIEVISGKLTELTIKLEKVKDDLKSGVIADKGGSVPKEEKGGGGMIWWILGGAAIVATVVLIASDGGADRSDTGTLSVTNQASSAVGIYINNESKGTIGANTTQSYTLDVGTYTVKISSINLSTKMQSLFAKGDAAESRYNGWNAKSNSRNDKSIRSLSGSRRNLSSFSKTYHVEISSGSTQTIVHNNSSWENGDIRINSTPAGAEIWLNGARRTEITNATLNDISQGVYTLTLKLSGYPDITDTVQVTNGTTTTKNYYFTAYVDLSNPIIKLFWKTNKGTIKFWATVNNIGLKTANDVSVRLLFQDANKLPIDDWTSWQVVVQFLQAGEQKDIYAVWIYTNSAIYDAAYYTWDVCWYDTPQSETPMRWQSEPIPIKK